MNRFFKNSLIWIACVLAGQLHAQYYFNVLADSSGFAHGRISVSDSMYFIVGAAFHPYGSTTKSVVLNRCNFQGQIELVDTFSIDGVATYNGNILFADNKILLFNVIDSVAPFSGIDADMQFSILSENFLQQSTQVFGGGGQEIAQDLMTVDGMFFILGATNSFGNGNGDFYLTKSDSIGNLLWSQTYGSTEKEIGFSVIKTKDDNLVLFGGREVLSSNWDLLVVKIDYDGNVIWEKQYGNSYNDYGGQIMALHDHTFIVYHNVDIGSTTVGYIDKLDGNGDLVWSKPFPYNGLSSFSWGKPIENGDGTILVNCAVKNAQGMMIGRLLKLNPMGNTLWTKEYYTREDYPQYINDIKPTPDGGYILCGTAWDSNAVKLAWLIKTDCNGAEDNMYPTGTPCDQYDCTLYPIDANFTSSAITIDLADGGTINFENNSANTTSRVWNFGDGNVDYTDSIMPHTFTQVGTYEVQLIVFHGMCSDTVTQTIEVINTTGIEDLLLETGMNIYPNPNQGDFTIRFKNAFEGQVNVLDLLGRNYRSIEITKESLLYEMSNLPKGVYVVELVMKNGRREVKRMEVL